jgi:outer membrane protein assembly factor BamB
MIKTTNHFFIQHQLTNGGLLLQDITTLQNIAAECPFVYGKAVYVARTLVMKYDSAGTEYINQREIDNNNQRLYYEEEKDIIIGDDVMVYPNPNNGKMYIALKNTTESIITFVLYDVTGREIKAKNILMQSEIGEVDASELSNGLYFYSIKNGDYQIATGKIIIVK